MAPWIDIAGWTLLHFVWQGTAIGIVAAVGFRLLRAAAPHVRYMLASAAMATMLIAPLATAARLSSTESAIAGPRFSTSAISSAIATRPLDVVPSRVAATSAARAPAARSRLDAVLPAIVLLWLTGVALLQLRLIGGWWHVRRLHRASLASTPSAWQTLAEALAKRIGLRRLVHVVEAHAVDIPTVIGSWRPVILLPLGALAGLTPGQADAILVHELAHIRRHDYLVNALQHVTETLLFYHPAVWWISRQMRIEREQCCDAVVVESCGDPVDYAAALAELEDGRSRRMALAVAATDGSLVHRIRVLLGAQPSHERPLADTLVTALVVVALVVVTGGGYRWPASGVRASAPPAPRVQTPAAGTDAVVLTVNGEAMTDGDVRRRAVLKRDRPGAPLSATLAAAVDERLVVQRGRQLGYALSDDEFESVLQNLMAQNGVATDAALQDVLAKQQLTLADIRRNIEAQLIASRVRFSVTPASITGEEARDRAWERYLQTLRSAAVLVWLRSDLQSVYEAGRAQSTPQGRADVPGPAPAAPPTPHWNVYRTEHFEISFTAGLNSQLQRVEREAERAYRRLSVDLRHDLSTRPNLVLFPTEAARAGFVVVPSGAVGTSLRTLLALDRTEDRFRADVAHEVTHAFEFDIVPAAVLNDGPEWIPEGLAEHEGEAWSSGDDELLRGLVRTDSVPALSAFERPAERRLSYAVGHAAFDFIAARWGMDGIRRLLFTLRQRQAADRGGLYPAAFGVPAEEFDRDFERYLRERFPSASLNLPVATRAQSIGGERIEVTVPLSYREDKTVLLGSEPVLVAVLDERVQQKMQTAATKDVFVHLDGALNLSEIVEIAEILKAAGVEHVGFEGDLNVSEMLQITDTLKRRRP